jgi:hypothetical protein
MKNYYYSLHLHLPMRAMLAMHCQTPVTVDTTAAVVVAYAVDFVIAAASVAAATFALAVV